MLIKATTRKIAGKQVKQLRAKHVIPASVYGPKRAPLSLEITLDDFRKVFHAALYSKLVELEIDGKKSGKVLIKEVQNDSLHDRIIHVSLYEVDMTKAITAEVQIKVTGESPAVKNNIGLLVTPVERVHVHCLPADLPSELVIDVSNFNQIGDAIHVGALKLPENVKFASDVTLEDMVAYISAPQKQIVEEEKPAEAVEGEVAEGEAVEGEAGKEGKAGKEEVKK
ncbi:MAG: 50S ribosomal protein L25 [bacterium]